MNYDQATFIHELWSSYVYQVESRPFKIIFETSINHQSNRVDHYSNMKNISKLISQNYANSFLSIISVGAFKVFLSKLTTVYFQHFWLKLQH